MKTTLLTFLGVFILSFSSLGIAGDNSCGSSYGCQDSHCSICQCTDPACGNKGYNNCISKSTCCKVFGNVGGIDI